MENFKQTIEFYIKKYIDYQTWKAEMEKKGKIIQFAEQSLQGIEKNIWQKYKALSENVEEVPEILHSMIDAFGKLKFLHLFNPSSLYCSIYP